MKKHKPVTIEGPKIRRAPCYEVPAHHSMLWEEYADETEELAPIAENGDKRAAGFSDTYMPETFERLYAYAPKKVENPEKGATVRQRLHEITGDLPEFATLKRQTQGDALWSGMAAQALSASVVTVLEEQAKKQEGQGQQGQGQDPDQAQQILDGLQALAQENEGLEAAIAEAQANLDQAQKDAQAQADALDPSAIRNAMRDAIEKAGEEIEGAQKACSSVGQGEHGYLDPKVAKEIARKVKASPQLKGIVEAAGRMKAIARAKRATRSEYARSEYAGVEQTKSFGNLLPHEMLGLATDIGTVDLYRRVSEGSALGYKLHGKEMEGKGPIVLVIDQSGSMSGNRDTWAKSIALALLDAARAQNRAFGVVLYDDRPIVAKLFPDAKNASPLEILEILSSHPSGGTNFRPAIEQALTWIETSKAYKKADVVHITDGDASTEGAKEARDRAKQIGTTIYGISIAGRTQALEAWSDTVTAINDVSQDTAAVNTIFDNV